MDRKQRGKEDTNNKKAKKPPVPSFAASTKKVVPASRPTPGGKKVVAKRSPMPSPRSTSGTPAGTNTKNISKDRSKQQLHSTTTKPNVRSKYGSLRNTEMCPKCGSLVAKGVIKHGGDASIGQFSIPPKDLVIDTSKILGEGGFGRVYLGDYQATEVAVKVMLGDKSPKKEEIAEWKKEVDIMTRLRHPNILSILGAVFEDGKLAIVTEYCAKGSLRKVVRDIARGARLEVTWGRKLDWLMQVAKGMAFLHHKRIHHRDLKASNVFVSGETMKIADFGLSNFRVPNTPNAKPATPTTSPLSQSLKNNAREIKEVVAYHSPGKEGFAPKPPFKGNVSSSSSGASSASEADASGTFAFVAPEVWAGKPFTNASDVYSFGVFIIETATSKVPFDEVPDEEEDKWANRIRRGTARPVLPEYVGGEPIPETLREVTAKCLAFEPKKRPDFRKIVRMIQQELDEPYSYVTCAVPYESDDDCEDPSIEQYDGQDDSEEYSDAEGWNRGEY